MRRMILTVIFGTFSTPAAEAQQKSRECSVDSAAFATHAASGVFRDCDVDKPAKLRNPPTPSYRLPREQNCATATLEFVVDSSGFPDTTTASVIETDDRDFAAAVLKTLPRWRYEPAAHQGRRVSQLVRERRIMEGRRMGITVRPGEPPPPLSAADRARFAPCR